MSTSDQHAGGPVSSLLQTCLSCAALIDVSEHDPFTVVHCPMCGTALRVQRAYNNYALMEVLGSGGMGTVYRAMDTNLNREVALKVLRKDYSANEEFILKLEREAQITALINHPNVVRVFSSGEAHGQFYIAMECVDKGSLDDLMQLQKRVAEIQGVEVGIQAAMGLEAAYARGLIHSDVKPGNILFADAHTAKIVDFGLATLLEEEAEAKGEVWGTPYYVSPERVNREPEDFRSDMYSLGATLFHAIAGRPPFDDATSSLVALRHIRSRAVSLQAFAPDVSSETAYVINRMLKRDVEERYQSYTELIEHLKYAYTKLKGGGSRPGQRARVVVESEDTQRYTGMLTLGMIVLFLVTGGIVAWKLTHGGPGDTQPTHSNEGGAKSGSFDKLAGPRFAEGRSMMASGRFDEAATAFVEVQSNPATVQPFLNWAALHQAACLLFSGDTRGATRVFDSLAKNPPYSTDPSEERLAGFFKDMAGNLYKNATIPKPAAKIYDKTNFEAFALLLIGAKDWSLGAFDDAAGFFEEYVSAEPRSPYEWIANYKPVANRYMGDYRLFQQARDALAAANTPQAKDAALKRVRDARANLSTGGVLAAELDRMARSAHGPKTASTPKPAGTPTPSGPTSGGGNLSEAEARAAYSSLLAKYRFSEMVAACTVSGGKPSPVVAALQRKAHWLEDFKSKLVADINRAGYDKPIRNRSGGVLPGKVFRATTSRLEMKVDYGIVPVDWGEIAPEMIAEIAESFTPTASETDKVSRTWLLGVFLCETGSQKRGKELLATAAQKRDDLKESLPIFFKVIEAPQ